MHPVAVHAYATSVGRDVVPVLANLTQLKVIHSSSERLRENGTAFRMHECRVFLRPHMHASSQMLRQMRMEPCIMNA